MKAERKSKTPPPAPPPGRDEPTPPPSSTPPALGPRAGHDRLPSKAEAELIIQRAAKAAHRDAKPRPTLLGQSAQAVALRAEAEAAAAPVERYAVDPDERRRAELARQAWESSRVPKVYRGADLRAPLDPVAAKCQGSDHRTFGEVVERLIQLLARPGTLALLGGWGTGKTWMACGLVREFCRGARYARFMDATDYFLALRSTYDDGARRSHDDVEAEHVRPELLVLDEMEQRGFTEFEDRMLTRLVNKRMQAGVSTLMLSNLSQPEFDKRVGPAIVDRLNQETCGVIVCDWPSLRGRIN